MAVYVVFRSHYDDPSGKRLKRFDDETVLDWFRNRWQELAGAPSSQAIADALADRLGFAANFLISVFELGFQQGLGPPQSEEELHGVVEEFSTSRGPDLCGPHRITVLDDDDDLTLCYYIFDDVYLDEHGDRAAYLLHQGWRLPAGSSSSGFALREPTQEWGPPGRGEGTTYITLMSYEDTESGYARGNLDDLPLALQIDGVRIPDFARYLAEMDPSEGNGGYLMLVRSQLLGEPLTDDPAEEGFRQALLDNPEDEVTWGAYADWLQEKENRLLGVCLLERALTQTAQFPVAHLPGSFWDRLDEFLSLREAGEAAEKLLTRNLLSKSKIDPDKARVRVEEHLAQICLHTDRWGSTDLYQQWIAFDDLWAAAHPDLANAILRYQRTWDVLSADEPA